MTFRVLVDDDAWSDYEDAETYFFEQGLRHLIPPFEEDLLATLRFIGENPTLRPALRPDVRNERLRLFKHRVWFRVFKQIEHVEVFAILHDSRGSGALDERL